MRSVTCWSVLFALIVCIAIASALGAQTKAPHPGDKAPEIKMGTVWNNPGGKTKLSEFRGEFVLVHLWGLPFAPASASLRTLQTLHEKLDGHAFRVFCVGKEDPKAVEQCKDACKVTFMIGTGSAESLEKDWGIAAWPVTYLIDPEGLVAIARWEIPLVKETVEPILENWAPREPQRKVGKDLEVAAGFYEKFEFGKAFKEAERVLAAAKTSDEKNIAEYMKGLVERQVKWHQSRAEKLKAEREYFHLIASIEAAMPKFKDLPYHAELEKQLKDLKADEKVKAELKGETEYRKLFHEFVLARDKPEKTRKAVEVRIRDFSLQNSTLKAAEKAKALIEK